MEDTPLLHFNDIAWMEIAPGAREKAFQRDGRTLRLLQLSPGFQDTEWCHRQHFGLVIAGSFTIEFADRAVKFKQGDGIAISAGEDFKHRARVGDEPVTMFLIDPH